MSITTDNKVSMSNHASTITKPDKKNDTLSNIDNKVTTQSNLDRILQEQNHIAKNKDPLSNTSKIVNLFRARTLNARTLSVTGEATSHSNVPELTEDQIKEAFSARTGQKSAHGIKNMSKQLFNRLKRNNRTSLQQLLSKEEEEDDDDENNDTLQRNPQHKISKLTKKEQVKEELEEMIGKNTEGNYDRTNEFLILQQAKKDLPNAENISEKDKLEINKALLAHEKDLYSAHGSKIRADINTAAIAKLRFNDKYEKVTQFSDYYYMLIQNPSIHSLSSLHLELDHNHQEFMELTNLYKEALDADKKGTVMPPSFCAQTMHDAIQVMDNRSKIDSFYLGIQKLIATSKNICAKIHNTSNSSLLNKQSSILAVK